MIASEEGVPPERIINTGDVVGYCGEPEACVQTVRNSGIRSIAGNVEIQLREGAADCGCNFEENSRCDRFAKDWFPFAQQNISREALEWMNGLPSLITFRFAGKQGLVLHGSYHETAEFIFRSTPWPVKEKNFRDSGSELILAGHCGLPFSDQRDGRLWLNAGAIGMPANDGTTRGWYAILQEEGDSFSYRFHSFHYDHEKAAQTMEAHGLPASYARTLRNGLWDNCDILPEEETAQQGIKLVSFDE